ncbi:MAG: glutamyl-tRNA reductase [Pseudomonadales bacterium]|nr:glutamyl-tRNA reductase [Pseudomonadales bacterium]
MGLLTFGINHRTAAVELREKLAFSPDTVQAAHNLVRDTANLNEVAILSTCNRTELYCSTDGNDSNRLIDWISDYHRLTRATLQACAYEYWNEAAVKHMFRVASGLDSMVLGEPQILGQLKSAYTVAKEARTIGPELGRVFQQTFSVAKQVRTDTDIGANPVSIAFAAVSLAKHIFSSLKETSVMLVGAGETVELVARHLKENQVEKIIVANRTLERAAVLAHEFDGVAITLEEIPTALDSVDIVVTSTASPLPILGKGAVEQALKRRKHKPMFMIDIAVPRDIEPEVGDLDDVYLYTVDDLNVTIKDNQQSRQESASQAEDIVELRVTQFMRQLRELDAVATLKHYRHSVESMREEEHEKAIQLIRGGMDPEEALTRMGHSLTNKILHKPSVGLRKAGSEGRIDLLDWARELFGLDDD